MRLLRHLLFYLGYILVLVLVTLLLLLQFFTPFAHRHHFAGYWPRFTIWWLKQTCGVDYEISGLEKIPSTPAIIMSNHQSTWETMAIQGLFPPLVWILKRELLFVPFFGWALLVLHSIAIDRSKGKQARDQLITQGIKRLQEGIHIVVFPEGTRVPAGEKRKYKPGGAVLAEKAGVPVVPVAHNAGYFWPRHGFFTTPGKIRMVVGDPIDTSGLNAAQINARVQQWIEAQLDQLGAPELR